MLSLREVDDGVDHLGIQFPNDSKVNRHGSSRSQSNRSNSSGSRNASSDASGRSASYVDGSRSNSLTSLLAGSEESDAEV